MTQLQLLYPSNWKEYELIDSGDGRKLEKFGEYTLIRPEPQAIWKPVLSEEKWNQLAHAKFEREQKDKFRFSDDIKGGWKRQPGMPESWNIRYPLQDKLLTLRLALTSFGHVGIFPEQGNNWNFIYETISTWKNKQAKVLNLFAYTGAASVVARLAGATVTHVDASRPGINWANQNMQLNNTNDIRWVYEDALKFVKREVKRGNKYNGVIMDPPPYGRGPDGEKWTLQEKLDELVGQAHDLLEPKESFFILSTYAVGLSVLVSANVVKTHFQTQSEMGEFFLKSKNKNDLPMGTFLRFKS